jgi:two-component system, cell cycle sensor histidine kinase DivJ
VLSSRGVFAAAQVLVHPSVAAPDRERHTAFVTHMLGLAFAALGIAPFFLALHGAPTLAESLLFALTLVPVSAAMIVARSGRLELGHLTASLGFTLVALVLCLVLHAGPGLSAAWLAVAMVEAAASLDVKVILAMSLSAGVAAALPAVATAVIAGLAIFVAALRLERLVADVTSQRAAMTRSFNRTRALEAAFGRAVVGFDATGSVCAVTAPRGSVLDTLEAEVVGRGLFDRVQVADRPAFQKLIDDAARTDATLVGTFRLRGPRVDGEEPGFRSVEVRAHRVVAGGEESVVAVLDDVTSRAGQDEAVESAARAMAEALHAKDMFLTTMTHELRTPLNAIIGFSDILASRTTRPDDVAKQREFARIINQSGQSLLAIVNAVLDMSRIRVGSYPIVAEPFDPAALLAQAIDAVSAAARDGGVRLARDVPAKLEEVVGDRRALRQAVVAVLSNAIKNTPERGTVTLGARPCGTALAITVADTGYGIAAKDLKHIGEPFFQAAGAGRGVGGSGLGLALVRGLLGLHGGTLSVESEAGGGTVVTLRIPLDCTTAPSTADAPIEIVPPRHRRTSPQLKDVA